MCGEVKSKEKEKTSSTPLVTVSDLQRMPMGQVIWLRLRMMPFKTKMTPDWKMNEMHAWGETYEKAGYQIREKKEVQLFDIRDFVKKKKKEKMEAMMNDSASSPMSGMGGNPFGGMSNPFSSPNPFSGMGGLGGGNPFNSLSGPSSSKSPFGEESISSLLGNDTPKEENGFNVDDLVKKIDAKIAELEEEERREQEAQKQGDQKIIDAEAEIKTKEDKQLYEEGTQSDDFFNDFFSDD